MKTIFLIWLMLSPAMAYAQDRLLIIAYPHPVLSTSGVTLPNARAIVDRVNDKVKAKRPHKVIMRVGGGKAYYKAINSHHYYEAQVFRKEQLPYSKAQIDNFLNGVESNLTYWSSGVSGEGEQLPVVLQHKWADNEIQLMEKTGWTDEIP